MKMKTKTKLNQKAEPRTKIKPEMKITLDAH